MAIFKNNHPISCPSCDFTRGETGSPQICGDGTMVCRNCHSKWRELGNSRTPAAATSYLPTPLNAISNPFQPTASPAREIPRLPASICLLTSMAVLLICMAWMGYHSYFASYNNRVQTTKPDHSRFTHQLTLDIINIEDIGNWDTAVWVISAKISNLSSQTLHVPAIQMRAGTKGSGGYLDHIYQPALQSLAPGANLKIRTAVHKPNPGASIFAPENRLKLEFVSPNLNSG